MKVSWTQNILGLALLVAGFVFFGPKTADALVLAPAKIEIEAAPGNVIKDRIILLNDSEETATFYSSVEKFEAQGESGTPNFVLSTEGLASWVDVPGSVTLAPNESREVPYVISLPGDAQPGGHFAAIFWSTIPPDGTGGGQVLVGIKSGILLLVGVAGEFEEKGGVIEFGNLNGKKLLSQLPTRLYYRFQNDGSDRLKPEGTVEIRNLFGGTASVLNANLAEGNVLPLSIRKFEILWAEKTKEPNQIHSDDAQLGQGFFAIAGQQWKNFLFGPYRAVLEVSYGADSQVDVAKFSFFAFPWQLLSLLVGGLALIIFGGRSLLLRYNRWVIAQAQGVRKPQTKKRKKK